MNNQITLLGTKGGPAVRRPDAMPTSSLLQLDGQTILIDCGVGMTRSIVAAGHSVLDIDAIFITHLHSDHILELGPFLYTAWTTGLSRPVPVFGPVGAARHWANFLAAMEYDYRIRIEDEGRPPLADLIKVSEYCAGPLTEIGPVGVSALRVDHPPVTECYALRFDGMNASAVFSADTCYFEPLAEFARGATVLVHEAMLLSGVERLIERTPNAPRLRQHLMASHTLASDAAKIAAQAGVGHLVLNHLVPADDPDVTKDDWLAELTHNWCGPVTIGSDGQVIVME